MAHGPIHGLPFPGLQEQGRRGAQPLQQPSLFDQTLPGLFSGQSNIRFDETQGGRFKKHFFGGLFGPTKKEREANAREQKAEGAAIKRRAQGLAGQIRVAGRGDALSFPAVRDAVQAAALGEAQGLSDVASIIGSQTQAQVQAQAQRQVTADTGAELALQQAQLAASGGEFGSFLSGQEFRAIESKVGGQMAGASSLFSIHDTVKNLTDAEILAIGQGAGGELQGQMQAELFALMRPLQTLLESGEGSVLRKSDQELIADVTGDPSSFSSLLFSREAKTLGKLKRLGELLQESAQRETSSLDARTLSKLSGVNVIRPSPFARPDGKTRPAAPKPSDDLVGEAGRARIEAVAGFPQTVSDFIEENKLDLDLSKGRF